MYSHNPRKNPENISEAGQSTVEFILSMSLIVGFILFLLQLSMVMAYGNYVQYVTFMAARAYLSAGTDPTDQLTRATNVITSSLKKGGNSGAERLPMIAKAATEGTNGMSVGGPSSQIPDYQYDPTKQDYSWMQGVRYAFNGKIFFIPLPGKGSGGAQLPSFLTFKSETFLGREATNAECLQDLTNRKGDAVQIYYDNGC